MSNSIIIGSEFKSIYKTKVVVEDIYIDIRENLFITMIKFTEVENNKTSEKYYTAEAFKYLVSKK